MQPELIVMGIVSLFFLWVMLKGLLYIGRTPMRRQQAREYKEEWWANYHADQAALEAAIAEFPGEADWVQARSDELMKEARKILS